MKSFPPALKTALAFALVIAVSVELTSRWFWSTKRSAAFFRGSEILYVFYPNVGHLLNEEFHPDPEHRDILVLGASVIEEMRPDFEALQRRVGGAVRFHMAAREAHTSLDSRRKAEWLEDLPYDEIFVYHGLNDCKYNSVPPELFDDLYSAYPFYAATAALLRHREVAWLVSPYTLELVWIKWGLRGSFWRKPILGARPEWRDHGSDLKTTETFRRNMEEIVRRSERQDKIVHLSAFGYYLPPGYTDEKYQAGEFDYAGNRLTVAVWGHPEDVRRCVEENNRAIRAIASRYQNARVIDFENGVPNAGRFYNDICHFSSEGRRHFFEVLADGLAPSSDTAAKRDAGAG
jgi:hypothetical protein